MIRANPSFLRLFSFLLFVLAVPACTDAGPPTRAADTPRAAPVAVPVRVAPVQDLQRAERLYFAGVARARQRASLSFQVGGTLASRPVDIGEHVSAGQVVASLYNPQLGPATTAAEARLAQLQADLEQAQRDLVRMEQLYERGLLAVQTLEQQRTLLQSTLAARDNADAVLTQSRQLHQESELRAPFAGRVEAVLLEPGEFAQPGQPVLRIAAEDGMEVEVGVPPHILGALAPGDTVPVRDSLSGQHYNGIIVEVGRTRSGSTALYPLIVALEAADLRGGEALEVGIQRDTGQQVSIPLSAVLRSAQGLSVFKVDAGHARRVPVAVQQIAGELAILEPGHLTPGEQVVYAGISRLADGDRLEVLP